jgi:hypothetical protein
VSDVQHRLDGVALVIANDDEADDEEAFMMMAV